MLWHFDVTSLITSDWWDNWRSQLSSRYEACVWNCCRASMIVNTEKLVNWSCKGRKTWYCINNCFLIVKQFAHSVIIKKLSMFVKLLWEDHNSLRWVIFENRILLRKMKKDRILYYIINYTYIVPNYCILSSGTCGNYKLVWNQQKQSR